MEGAKGAICMKAILYIGHGTRSKMGVQEAISFVQRVKHRVDVPIQEVSFLELTEPSIEQGFQQCVERGATEITVVPLFLLAAGHIKKDIPEALSLLKKSYPEISIMISDPFGVQERIFDAIAELVRQTIDNIKSNDSVLIVGRGSSDPGLHATFAEIASGVGGRLGIENISVCYLAATEPSLEEGLETISHHAESRVIVIPYLLFSGLLLTEIKKSVKKRQKNGQDIVQTGPLTEHRVIEDIVIQRATEEGTVHAVIND
jgi:sirohydrochlorin ferrochelatase